MICLLSAIALSYGVVDMSRRVYPALDGFFLWYHKLKLLTRSPRIVPGDAFNHLQLRTTRQQSRSGKQNRNKQYRREQKPYRFVDHGDISTNRNTSRPNLNA